MSYSLLILVFSFCSSMSFFEICLAASSREITLFQLTNKPMNCLHKMPNDFSFFDFLSLLAMFGESQSDSKMVSILDRDEFWQLEDIKSNYFPFKMEDVPLLSIFIRLI